MIESERKQIIDLVQREVIPGYCLHRAYCGSIMCIEGSGDTWHNP